MAQAWHVPPRDVAGQSELLGFFLAYPVLYGPPMPIIAEDLTSTPEFDSATPLPDNMWAADLDGYQPTDADRGRWSDNASPARELDPLVRAADLGWCDFTRSDGSQAREACYSTPFLDLY